MHVRAWNITAQPLPFLNILLEQAFWADLGSYQVRAPAPEAFFVHKLIAAQRRPGGDKRSKDLEQCAAIAGYLGRERLQTVMGAVKLGPAVQKALRASAAAISFPPRNLGIG